MAHNSLKDLIYMDNNATTPMAPEVIHAVSNSASNFYGNPSSSSVIGRAAKKLIIQSRSEIAQLVNSDPSDIIFTSGGTEANNWVIYSVIKHYYANKPDGFQSELPHIVTTNAEHDAIIEPIKKLVDEGKVRASFVSPDSTGVLTPDRVVDSLKNETVLVSIMLGNNETGSVFPVGEIMKQVKARMKHKPNFFCHSDAAQAIGRMKVDVRQLNVDYLTIVGHKFYGPRIGALYIRKPSKSPSLLKI